MSNEQRARELLAAEYDRGGAWKLAAEIRENQEFERLSITVQSALRAIMAALAQQVPADGEWAEEVARKLDDGAPGILYRQDLATILRATPQAPQPTTDSVANRYESVVPQLDGTKHPDDVAVDLFASAMKAKLEFARNKRGRGGWQDKTECTAQLLSDLLRGHVEKGDPTDVANFACFLWNRGEGIQQQAPQPVVDGMDDDALAEAVWQRIKPKLEEHTKDWPASQPRQGAVAWVDPRDWELFVNIDQDRPHAARKVMLARRQTKLRTLPLYTTIGQQAVDDANVSVPRHYAENVLSAACLLEQSPNLMDRREGAALRKFGNLMLAAHGKGDNA